MKKFILTAGVSLLTMAGGVGVAQASPISTATMVSVCQDTTNRASLDFCNGYAQGVYDLYLSNVHPQQNPAYVCFPAKGASRADVIKGYVAWASTVPQYGKLPAADSMMRYLATTYPCKK